VGWRKVSTKKNKKKDIETTDVEIEVIQNSGSNIDEEKTR